MIVMRKYLFLFLMLCCSVGSDAMVLDGKFISQSGELMFIFTNDSLYIDIAQSQRTISAFKLVKNKETNKSVTFDAYESYVENGKQTYREVMIRVTREKGRKFVLEYFGKDKDRDYNSNERYNIRRLDD